MQNHYSLVYREEEREMFPTLKHFGVGSIPWSPLARGLLTRPFKSDKLTTRANSDPCVPLDALCAWRPQLADSAGGYSFTGMYLEGLGTQEIINRLVLTQQAAWFRSHDV